MLRRAFCLAVSIAGATSSCRAGHDSNVVVIPQATALAPEGARQFDLPYHPRDDALEWLATDSILVAHAESYAAIDVSAMTCEGTGVYLVPASGIGKARALRTGKSICGTLGGDGLLASDARGEFVMYSVRMPASRARLFRLRLKDGALDSLTLDCQNYVQEPAVSPDGREIAFSGDCGRADQRYRAVYVSHSDGGGVRRVYGGDSVSASSPVWAPDRQSLALNVERRSANGFHDTLIVVAVDGRRIGVMEEGFGAAFSPDGEWLAYLHFGGTTHVTEIHLVKPNGASDRAIFRNDNATRIPIGWAGMPGGDPTGRLVWKPDSKMLLFSREFAGGRSLWRIDIATGRVTQITAPARARKPSFWSRLRP
jgi:hypothetical protein